jgi:hypothetical protein
VGRRCRVDLLLVHRLDLLPKLPSDRLRAVATRAGRRVVAPGVAVAELVPEQSDHNHLDTRRCVEHVSRHPDVRRCEVDTDTTR